MFKVIYAEFVGKCPTCSWENVYMSFGKAGDVKHVQCPTCGTRHDCIARNDSSAIDDAQEPKQ